MELQELVGFNRTVIIIGGHCKALYILPDALAAPRIMDIRHLIVKELLEVVVGLNACTPPPPPPLPQIKLADLICISPKWLAAISSKKPKHVMRKKGKYF